MPVPVRPGCVSVRPGARSRRGSARHRGHWVARPQRRPVVAALVGQDGPPVAAQQTGQSCCWRAAIGTIRSKQRPCGQR